MKIEQDKRSIGVKWVMPDRGPGGKIRITVNQGCYSTNIRLGLKETEKMLKAIEKLKPKFTRYRRAKK